MSNKNFENVSLKTIDGHIIDGIIILGEKNRVSELFTDNNIYFIEMNDTIDDSGNRKDKIFVNKDQVLWVNPKEVKKTDNVKFLENTNYKKVSIKSLEKGVIIDGKMNILNNENISHFFSNFESTSPFIILVEAIDSNENRRHTLFINKKAIITIEEV